MKWATHKKDIDVSIKLLNKGFSEAKNLTAKLSATRSNAAVTQGESKFGSINPGL